MAAAPLRVMVVDDSAVARGFMRRWLEAEQGIEIVAALRTGREAIDYLERADPDVVLLDVAMPDMDGITALPLLLNRKPGLAVIMASTLTRKNFCALKGVAEVELDALLALARQERSATLQRQPAAAPPAGGPRRNPPRSAGTTTRT